MNNQEKKRLSSKPAEIISAVKTPLGFFVLVVLVVEAILGTLSYTSNDNNVTLAIVGMVVILLALIAVVAFLAYYRPEALRGMRAPDLSVRATVIYPPTEKERYNQLFGGFSNCDFYAYNPPFKVEHAGDKILEEAVVTHKKRYESKVKSRYLFFDKESHGNAEHFFGKLADAISKENVDQNINRVCWDSPTDAPGFTFFIGYKHNTPAIVLYPRAVMQNGIPRAVIYIEGAEDLLSILREFFLSQWNEARKHLSK